MEWTGKQQLLFLLQSAGLGFGIGVLFEMITGVGRCVRRRWCRFVLDAAFGIPAAFITFFGALVIMDGQLHPLLFAGCVIGFLAEHGSIGGKVAALVYGCLRLLRRALAICTHAEEWFWGRAAALCCSILPKRAKNEKKSEKKTKKLNFFEKKA